MMNAPEIEPLASISAELEKAAVKIAAAWQPLVEAVAQISRGKQTL